MESKQNGCDNYDDMKNNISYISMIDNLNLIKKINYNLVDEQINIHQCYYKYKIIKKNIDLSLIDELFLNNKDDLLIKLIETSIEIHKKRSIVIDEIIKKAVSYNNYKILDIAFLKGFGSFDSPQEDAHILISKCIKKANSLKMLQRLFYEIYLRVPVLYVENIILDCGTFLNAKLKDETINVYFEYLAIKNNNKKYCSYTNNKDWIIYYNTYKINTLKSNNNNYLHYLPKDILDSCIFPYILLK